MPSAHVPTVTLTNLGLEWPDGSTALRGITASFGRGRTGLVGLNGSGKSTLLKLISAELVPSTGTVATSGDVAYLPQDLALDVAATAVDLLGVRAKVDAVRAIAAGDASAENFETVGSDWDIETRAADALRSAGLDEADLFRPVGQLSGGETILLAIAGLRLGGAPITLLDEPTNNLDRDARGRLGAMVRSWKGALIVVSHDVELLDLMDDTAELRDGSLSIYGGPYSAYRAYIDQEQSAAQQAQKAAEQVLKVEKRQRIDGETKLAHRAAQGRRDFENRVAPKIVMNAKKASAQVSAGKLRTESAGKVRDARQALEAAEARVRSDDQIHVDLPDPNVPAGRRLADLVGTNRTVVIQGPERVALTGPNGVGKTTLLEALVHPATARAGLASATAYTDHIGYLSQRLDGLDDAASVLENVRAAAPELAPGLVRNRLARFLIRGDAVERTVGTLSGGERFRVALACVLLADPPPQLLVLDEPTNNLDLQSVDQLVSALGSYRGGILVVSHDENFLGRLGLTSRLELDREGQLLSV